MKSLMYTMLGSISDIIQRCHCGHHVSVSNQFISVCILSVALIDNLSCATRSQKFRRSKQPTQGITGREKNEDSTLYRQRMSKLFLTIVNNSATITNKRELGSVSSQFINMESRGTAVAIGPLEYCGSGLPITPTRGNTM